MRAYLVAITVLLSAPGVVVAGTGPAGPEAPICSSTRAAIEYSVKDISALDAANEYDSSDADADARSKKQAALRQHISENETKLKTAGCAPYTGPLDPQVYRPYAMRCASAQLNAQLNAFGGNAEALTTVRQACDSSKWGSPAQTPAPAKQP